MLKQLQAILLFQKKLFLPGIVISVLIGIYSSHAVGGNIFKVVLISYFFISPLFHYFIYDVRNGDEYYFYGNFGLSRSTLWCSTVAVGLFCVIVSLFI